MQVSDGAPIETVVTFTPRVVSLESAQEVTDFRTAMEQVAVIGAAGPKALAIAIKSVL